MVARDGNRIRCPRARGGGPSPECRPSAGDRLGRVSSTGRPWGQQPLDTQLLRRNRLFPSSHAGDVLPHVVHIPGDRPIDAAPLEPVREALVHLPLEDLVGAFGLADRLPDGRLVRGAGEVGDERRRDLRAARLVEPAVANPTRCERPKSAMASTPSGRTMMTPRSAVYGVKPSRSPVVQAHSRALAPLLAPRCACSITYGHEGASAGAKNTAKRR